MNRLTLILILTMTVLLGSPGVSWGADFQKGLDAYERGDYATALKEFTPLAEPGYALAQYNLGVGYALAQFNLGAMYDKGRGVPQDYQTAVKWYTLAAEKGYAPAQYNLGVMYGMGQGVPEDYKTAVKWFALAAEQGYAPAQFNLGVMYAKGDGVIKDNVYAHMWGNIAASNGNEKGGCVARFGYGYRCLYWRQR